MGQAGQLRHPQVTLVRQISDATSQHDGTVDRPGRVTRAAVVDSAPRR